MGCSLDQPRHFFRGDELTPALPSGAPRNRSWADSTRYRTCRGGVVLEVTRLAWYRVEPSDSAAFSPHVIRLIRVAQITVAGTGTQWEQPVSVTGRGAAIDTMLLAPE